MWELLVTYLYVVVMLCIGTAVVIGAFINSWLMGVIALILTTFSIILTARDIYEYFASKS